MLLYTKAGEPGILITHGFLNRWYFTGSISSPGSGFIGLIGASSGKSAGGFCGERSCLTRGKVEGVMVKKNGRGRRKVPHFIYVSLSLSLTGPLCFLLMNSLISVLKRTARILLCLRAAIRGLMVLLTNIWAGVTVAHFNLGFLLPVFTFSHQIFKIGLQAHTLYFYQFIFRAHTKTDVMKTV